MFKIVVYLSALILPAVSLATEKPGEIPAKTSIAENVSETVSLDLLLTDSSGTTGTLKDFGLTERPTIIVPVYFRCPRLCSLTLNGLLDGLREQEFVPGKDFNILTVSFAEKEGPELASAKQKAYLSALSEEPGRLQGTLPAMEELKKGWRFLTGEPESVTKLMEELGFKYVYDQGEYSHSSAMMLVSPGGKITHYFYGFPIKGKDLRLALIDSSKGIIGSAFDRVLLYCFRFDATNGQYTLAVLKLMQVVGGLSFFGLGATLWVLKKQEPL